MRKSLLALGALGVIFAAPAYAEDMKCDEASMKMMQTEMDGMTDEAMKDKKMMATEEMAMAKKSMEESKMDDCMMHMQKAEDAMKKG